MNPHPDSHANDTPGTEQRRCLSAAADGDTAAMDAATRAWRDDANARATWHAYHLIGDVLRSSDLAAAPARDAAFLSRLRSKLATEPVLLAPLQPVASKRPTSAWWMSAAVAAGFVVVAGVLVVARVSVPPTTDSLAQAGGPGAAIQSVPQTVSQSSVIRDPRLDEFLRVHQSARAGLTTAAAGSALRRVDVELQAGPPR